MPWANALHLNCPNQLTANNIGILANLPTNHTLVVGQHGLLATKSKSSQVQTIHTLLTMQHVYGHIGNLGNGCADHAAALGTLGLVSNHNLAARWVRHNFYTSACFGSCNNIGEVLEKSRNIRTETAVLPHDGS